jgi:hypothetical protein
MIRFFKFAAISLLIFSLSAGFSVAQSTKTYRKPTKSDIDWLLGSAKSNHSQGNCDPLQIDGSIDYCTDLVPKPCTPLQIPVLDTDCDPCEPVKSRKEKSAPLPPMPDKWSVHRKDWDTEDEDETEGVSHIAPVVLVTPIVQMSGKQLPPPDAPSDEPAEIPPLTEPAISEPVTINSVHDGNLFCGDTGCADCSEQHQTSSIFDMVKRLHRTKRSEIINSRGYDIDFDIPDMIGDAAWLPGYYAATNDFLFSAPNLVMSRLNVAEHFNAETRNRVWTDYRHWNNAATIDSMTGAVIRNEDRAVDLFTFGVEHRLNMWSSVELRVPVIGQFSTFQSVDHLGTSEAELGNISTVFKYALLRRHRFTFSGGIGTTIPTAKDWRVPDGRVLKNEAYHLIPFLGVQWHPNDKVFGHFLVQTDIPIEKNIFGDATIDEQKTIRAGIQLGRWFYRNEEGKHSCRLGGIAEVDYQVATDSVTAEEFSGGVMFHSPFRRSQTLSAAVGIPVQFGSLALTNAVILPLTAHQRSASVGYNFSLSRRF